jgi:3'(2'), 5'-bisphosphate nucleotidase
MNLQDRNELAIAFGNIASAAGEVIMTIRASAVSVNVKSDGSPVTQADIKAESLIRERLGAIMPDVPIIAEESFEAHRAGTVPERFLLVDPLDGTREFVSGKDEFTVNIALVEAASPIVGAICAPALGHVSLGGTTAARAEVEPGRTFGVQSLHPIHTSLVPSSGVRAVGSRSHMDPTTEKFVRELKVSEMHPAGSSLKFCLVARGDADVYPRFAPTMEWDTAAGHAILSAAGGCVLDLAGGPLRYGKTAVGFKNDGFVAWGSTPLR